MTVYCVSYDLKTPRRDYEPLISELKKSQSWWHYLESTWLIKTEETAQQLWGRLGALVTTNDAILIIEVRRNYWGFLAKDAWDWINSNVPQ